MKLVLLAMLGVVLTPAAEVIVTFAPQENITSRVALWTVAACPSKAISITTVYALATHRGIPWITPRTASELFRRKSAWSLAAKVAGYLSAGGAVVTGSDWVKARPQWTASLAIGGAVLVVLVPMAQKEIPIIDPSVGQSLMLNVDGCGITSFYATPSNIAGFNEVLP